MEKSWHFIINERLKLKKLYVAEYPKNSRWSQSLIKLWQICGSRVTHLKRMKMKDQQHQYGGGLLNLFSLTFLSQHQCIVKCPLYPLSIARFYSWEQLVFLNFEAAPTFLTWLRLYLITTASKLAYISLSVHSCTKNDQQPHIKIESNLWSNKKNTAVSVMELWEVTINERW